MNEVLRGMIADHDGVRSLNEKWCRHYITCDSVRDTDCPICNEGHKYLGRTRKDRRESRAHHDKRVKYNEHTKAETARKFASAHAKRSRMNRDEYRSLMHKVMAYFGYCWAGVRAAAPELLALLIVLLVASLERLSVYVDVSPLDELYYIADIGNVPIAALLLAAAAILAPRAPQRVPSVA